MSPIIHPIPLIHKICWPTILNNGWEWVHRTQFNHRWGRFSVDGNVCGPDGQPRPTTARRLSIPPSGGGVGGWWEGILEPKADDRWNIHIVDFYQVVAIYIIWSLREHLYGLEAFRCSNRYRGARSCIQVRINIDMCGVRTYDGAAGRHG